MCFEIGGKSFMKEVFVFKTNSEHQIMGGGSSNIYTSELLNYFLWL